MVHQHSGSIAKPLAVISIIKSFLLTSLCCLQVCYLKKSEENEVKKMSLLDIVQVSGQTPTVLLNNNDKEKKNTAGKNTLKK